MVAELRARVFAPVRALVTMLLSVAGVLAAVLVLVSSALVVVGIGRYAVPPAVWLLRKVADAARALVRMAGVDVRRPYGPETSAIGLLKARSTWRDIGWAFIDPVIGTWATALAIAMPLFGVYGAVVQPFVWRANERAGGINSFGPIHVTSTVTALAAIPVGLAMIAAGLYIGPPLLTLRASWSADLLGPSRTTALEERVETLVETRADSAGAQAAELRRIERDLHDGAQARLVALGMSLSNAERLFEEDPEAARNLVIAAREASSRALDQLRDLVRGVHPPVLADRGLADAIRALALDSLLEVEVRSDLPGRPSLPVESAVYFAANELLANTAKHARSATTVAISLHYTNGVLRCVVTDDGPGGADPMNGTGLRGIESRLAIFDGTVEVDSPVSGPTRVQLEVPCAIRSV
ncbi:signal transduction histidine kinase [Kribbella rubisoli]|uniref:histidine kinase n=1 Tax=Kribbella rubisoli TaxID=3075929 RepID=A0A4Q7WQS0_9ACTN|nr:sensor domain-containing protein [Kribbella rubisoli]RZU12607.1 signal transduction histidine kinase [Kribbella rubisoli]